MIMETLRTVFGIARIPESNPTNNVQTLFDNDVCRWCGGQSGERGGGRDRDSEERPATPCIEAPCYPRGPLLHRRQGRNGAKVDTTSLVTALLSSVKNIEEKHRVSAAL